VGRVIEVTQLQEDLINYRVDNKLTQAEMAKKIGVHVNTYTLIENGVSKPWATTEAKIYRIIKK
jgi:DNA-binding XRE family transcriptional regulator